MVVAVKKSGRAKTGVMPSENDAENKAAAVRCAARGSIQGGARGQEGRNERTASARLVETTSYCLPSMVSTVSTVFVRGQRRRSGN